MLKKKPIKKKSKVSNSIKRKRKNPEIYNLIHSDNIITKMTAKQAIQHIEMVSTYPIYIRDDPFSNMDPQEILEYIHNFANRWEYFH